jgi:hypothetical protein
MLCDIEALSLWCVHTAEGSELTTSLHLPAFRAELLALCEDLGRNACCISCVHVHSVTPPLLDIIGANISVGRVLKSKVYHDRTDSVARIQRSR